MKIDKKKPLNLAQILAKTTEKKLTMDELKQMVGEPVYWAEKDTYGFVSRNIYNVPYIDTPLEGTFEFLYEYEGGTFYKVDSERRAKLLNAKGKIFAANKEYRREILNEIKMLDKTIKPLTMDELKQMKGELVYCEEKDTYGFIEIPVIGLWKDKPHFTPLQSSDNVSIDIKKENLTCYSVDPKIKEELLGKNEQQTQSSHEYTTKSDQFEPEDDKQSEPEESFGSKYYDEFDKAHAQILEQCAAKCYSSKKGFTEEAKLNNIRKLLKDTDYKEVFIDTASVWVKGNVMDFKDKPVYLVSSHADLVDAITKPFSELSDDGYYKGTYDNIGTNAAAVIAMREADLPDNVVFTFTSDEETGRCRGAKDTVSLLTSMGLSNLTCIALDVTDEGYDEGVLASIENCVKDDKFLNKLGDLAMSLETEGRQSFCFVKKSKKAIPDNLPDKYIQKSTGMYDEAMKYADLEQKSFSLCLPTDGWMHSNAGLTVRQPVFEGYVNMLECMLYQFTKTHENLLGAKKLERETLLDRVSELMETEKKKPKYHQQSFYDYDNSMYDYDAIRDYNASYGYDYEGDYFGYEENFEEMLMETVVNNIEAYSPEDKGMFIRDCISQVAPDLMEQFQQLQEFFANEFDAYQEQLQAMEYEGYTDDFDLDFD